MKKYQFLWIVLLFVFLLWGCGKAPANTTATNTAPTDTVPADTTPTESTGVTLYPNITECAVIEGILTEDDLLTDFPSQVVLSKQQESKDANWALVVEIYSRSVFLQTVLDGNVIPLCHENMMFLGDVDADGIQEILIHHNTGGCGGSGSYQTWVLKAQGNDFQILFEADSQTRFDTGFESRFLEGYQMEVKNKFTGYTLVYDVKDRYGAYIDQAETMPDGQIFLDTFSVFEPKDTNGDGISEILCKQYTSYVGRSDYTGTACSVLKFNTQTQAFEVIDAWYEPNTET